jgi:uncharacterized damage-inducible protein DinB
LPEAERLQRELEATFAGDPWYGSPVARILDGIDAAGAAARPIAGAHSIWELVLHMTAWVNEARRRIEGGKHGEPVEGDWPAVTATTPEAWAQTQAGLRRAHAELARTLATADDATLAHQVAGGQVDASGRPVTLYQTVVGVLQHDTYHAGQIAVLKKALLTFSIPEAPHGQGSRLRYDDRREDGKGAE